MTIPTFNTSKLFNTRVTLTRQSNEWNRENNLNQFRVAHGVVSNDNHIHVIGGSASASDVASFGVGLKGLEVMDTDGNGKTGF